MTRATTPEVASESWDLEAVYDAEIAPLMTRIIAICKGHRMPMVASFAYFNEPDGVTSCCTTLLPFKGREVPELVEAFRAVRRRPSFLAMTVFSPGSSR